MDRYFNSFRKYRKKLLGLQNVVGVGIGHKSVGGDSTGEPAYIVYVEKKRHTSDLVRSHIVPRQIDGLDTDVVEIGVVRMLGLRTSRQRPCRPGISIGHYQSTAGTLGAIVKDKKTNEWMLLSNNHVLANGSGLSDVRAKIGDPILQPGPYDGGTLKDRVGVLHRYVPLVKSVARADCPVASALAAGTTKVLNLVKRDYEVRLYKNYEAENTVDCAIAKLDAIDLVKMDVLDIGMVKGVADVKVGQKVQKSGRTSGLTSGVVKSIGTTLQVEMKEEEKVWFTDQVVTDMRSQPGDSGSIILNEGQDVVGLLFAGSDRLTIFNRINNVMERLGVRFD